MKVNRQVMMIWLRFGLYALLLAVNAYVLWELRAIHYGVLALSLLILTFFHLLVAAWLEPQRLQKLIRAAEEELVIPPHFAWDIHRDSKSDWSNVPGTLALTNRTLRFVTSPLYIYEDLHPVIPLHLIVKVSGIIPERRWGHYLELTLRDGAKMKIRVWTKRQHTRWLKELRSRTGGKFEMQSEK